MRLSPPLETGFTGTALLHEATQAGLIEELIKRGYTRVDLHERH